MTTGTIVWLISIAINIIICTLFCTAVYNDDDDKVVIPKGVSILIGLLGCVKYLSTAIAVILIIIFIAMGCDGYIYFNFKNKFLDDLFTR